MPPVAFDLYEPRPTQEQTEQFFSLLESPGFRLEHIVSHGRPSAPAQWYDEPTAEWVLLLRGQAMLNFGDGPPRPLRAGSHILIPAHCRHRVDYCSLDAHWLALHFPESVGTP